METQMNKEKHSTYTRFIERKKTMAKTKFITLISWIGLMALLLSACDRPVIVGFDPGYQPTNGDHQFTNDNDQHPSKPAGLEEISVEDVSIDLAEEYPVQVMVKISGTWPGLCTQLAGFELTTDEETFMISLLAAPDGFACPSTSPGSRFMIDIPLNMAGKPAGTYTVSVNGKATSFDWSG